MPSGQEDKHVMRWIRSQHSSWEKESNCIHTEDVFLSPPPFSGSCWFEFLFDQKSYERGKGEKVRRRCVAPQRLAYSPRPLDPNSQFEGVDLYFSEVNRLWWYKYTSNGKHTFFCNVAWIRTSLIIIHWTFCATLSVAILRRGVRSDAQLSCTETRF